MKKAGLLLIILFCIILVSCDNTKDIIDSQKIFTEMDYDVSIEVEDYFAIEGITRVIAKDDLKIAAIFFCENKHKADELYKNLYNLYLAYIYSPDIYGYNNMYKTYYGIIDDIIIENNYYEDIDWELLQDYTILSTLTYFFGNLETVLLYPNFFLPETYEEYKTNIKLFRPQIYKKGNNIYFGYKEMLDLVN